MKTKSFLVFLVFILFKPMQAQERPFIWVKKSEREQILNKIENTPWANSFYCTFITRLENDISMHQQNPDKFLRRIPFDWENAKEGETPPFFYTIHTVNGERRNLDNATDEEYRNGKMYESFLKKAVNCGVAYYLTRDDKYAQCATDILYAAVKGIIQLHPSNRKHRGGWMYPDDILAESRFFARNLPIVYDFISPFLRKGGKPYDIVKKTKTDFPYEITQKVFRTYASLVVNHGMINSNHPVLEAACLVYCAMGLEDKKEREDFLKYYLTESTENQDALDKVALNYKIEGAVWPESSQYLNHVAILTTRLMLVLDKYDPSLKLGIKYENIPLALPILDYLVYPNGEIIRWGDGHRYGRPSYNSYEDAYLLGKYSGNEKLTKTFGGLLAKAFDEGKYKRNGLMALLWYNEINENSTGKERVLPRTDNLPHAGIFIQRNFTEFNNPENGLMCFVGGAHMVHGHAEGMNIELYGKGHVLGVDNGRGSYQKDIHENYSRLFAAHNTVIVNGNSCSDSGWVNLGINTVRLISMEPLPKTKAVSPNFSFIQTAFVDDKGDKAEAIQERTLALIRTSENTGYYLDVFRSKSKLPNEYHDYLYHNIGDKLEFDHPGLKLLPTPERYQANANRPWVHNNTYRHPGWHFFKDVCSSSTFTDDVKALFTITHLEDYPIYMGLYIPGFKNREYTKVKAPRTFEAPGPYGDLPTPALVIRKKGEAWKDPFVVVYEPFDGDSKKSGILSVRKLEENGYYKGLKIVSTVGGKKIEQYVITQSGGQVYNDESHDIYFKGTFAILTFDNRGKLQNMYIGEGKKLQYKTNILKANSVTHAAYKEF